MDKEWVFLQRGSVEYNEGLRAFINHASIIAGFNGRIKCPCRDCSNKYWKLPAEVEDHIGDVGMWPNYVNAPWKEHGEKLPAVDITPPLSPHGDMPDMLHDAFGMDDFIHEAAIDDEVLPPQGSIPDVDKFFRLVKEAETELYPGCGRTKLSFLVRLYKVKCLSGWTDASMTLLLSELKDWLPLGEQLPESFYKARKIIKDLGLTYEKIDACKNDCMLYRKEYVNDTKCKFCGTSRYKSDVEEEDGAAHKVPNKVLRYFPLGPRVQRLYMSRHTAESMVWHAEHRPKDEVLRHPADSPAWSKLDNTYPEFGSEARNVRLGLASDGFNPFGTMSLSHSTWPVIMSVYNLPPWLCMKQPYMMLSLLIPGLKSPSKDINVYLQPLVDELKSLWDEGLPTFDSFKKETFIMRAALLWTINDFPAYAMLSGWSTKGKKACPVCADGTDSERLPNGHKECYRGHRRWLDKDHPFRFMTRSFNGKPDHRSPPKPMDGKACLRALRGLHFRVGKAVKLNRNGKRPPKAKEVCPFKAKSAFFDLPYWKDLLLRHNLDVMHIEKNVTDTIIGSLLGIVGKNKDSLAARLDCVKLDIKDNLHPRREGNRMVWNGTILSLTPEEKTLICEVLESAKPPDGFSSNVSRCVRVAEKKLVGLKSHDCHVIMQYLLPLAIRRVLPRKVVRLLLELSGFFRNLCTKVGTAAHFALLRIASVLCHLEKSLPPSFFDVMMHLLIHLADEAAIAGPVHYRWMYPIERYVRCFLFLVIFLWQLLNCIPINITFAL